MPAEIVKEPEPKEGKWGDVYNQEDSVKADEENFEKKNKEVEEKEKEEDQERRKKEVEEEEKVVMGFLGASNI